MDSKEIAEAMRRKLPVNFDGITYRRILEYILWYDDAGQRKTSVTLLDKTNRSTTRAPADRIEPAEKEG